MKFIKLEIRNLASLDRPDGEIINFEEGALGNSTIFSIVGPTGSGKSTILDAICLALYNRAPRYPRKKGDKNQNIEIFGEPEEGEKNRLAPTDSRNILTRGKKEGYSKLTFLANNGDVYRAEWSVRKLLKNYENARTALFKISQTGDTLTEEQAEWDKLPQIIGLDYEQFLRTVLIAQGSFANFLTAKENERYELLEKLIGCEEKYVNIATRIKQQKDDAVNAYNQIAANFSAQEKDIIPEEELAAVKERIDELKKQEEDNKAELQNVQKAIDWYTTNEKYLANISTYEAHFNEAKKNRDAQHEQVERLNLHDTTLPAIDLYKEMKNAEQNISNHTRELKNCGTSIANKEQTLKEETEVALAKLQQAAEAAAKELEQQKPHINRAREIKAQMKPLQDALDEKETAFRNAKNEANKVLNLLTDKTIDIYRAEELYEIKNAELEKRNAENRNELASDELKEESIRREDAQLQTLRDARTLLLSQDVMALRNNLTDGEPCPVCGAIHHPYHDPAKYAQVTTDLDKQISEKQQELERKKTRVKTLKDELSTEDALYKYVAMLKIAKDAAEKKKAQDQAEEAFSKAKKDLDRKKEELKQEIGDKEPDAYELALTNAKNHADKAVTDKNEAIAGIREQITQIRGTMVATEQQARNEQTTRDSKQKELTQWLADYNAHHADKPLTTEDIALLYSSQDDWETIRTLQAQLSQAYTAAETTLSNEKKAQQDHQLQKPEQAKEALLARKVELDGISTTELVDTQARLQRHDTAKLQMGAMFEQKQQAEERKTEWEQIADAIGSDGKTLRKIAQCYTLRFLIEHANVEIRKFNSRYELLQVKNSLGIRVIDHDRADDIRDTTSLSGGETFIVSLGLALGLSALSSRNISFENLFIDEGFGTLDPDMLDHVIDSLAMLQMSQGKKVGVISHTDSMSERIGTQIRIIKNGNSGSSHIEIYPQ